MKPDPLPAILCPHGWRKFEQAQANMRRFGFRYGIKNQRRARKWALAMRYWLDHIYRYEFRIE